ncbi:hypothetical protein ACJMK2_010473 [Sinanodonta woodiana]|uniref:MARVEL domain-containing protein n=1 Tax=Sinanodonta woodiana TaxID=1069815 RepID=A0ABD3VFH6_SINWO
MDSFNSESSLLTLSQDGTSCLFGPIDQQTNNPPRNQGDLIQPMRENFEKNLFMPVNSGSEEQHDKQILGSNEGNRIKKNPVIETRTQPFHMLQYEKNIVLMVNKKYCCSCNGLIGILQVILSLVTFICLVTSGHREGGLLLLPLAWHFRILIFVLLLTSLTSLLMWIFNLTGLILLFPFNWYLINMVMYSVFSFLYLVGASMVASVVDFYEKMGTDVSEGTIEQLVTCVVLSYFCMFLYGLTAFVGYKQWRIQYKLYQRRRLLEEEEFDI